jgi:hypothetical protein
MRRVVPCIVALAVLAGSAGAGTKNVNGLYETKLSGLAVKPLNGDWLLSIAQSRAYAVARNGKTVIGGKLKISGSTLAFQDVLGPYACQGAQAVGTYSYTLVGKTLKLKKLKDSCSGRVAILTTHPLTKVR